MTLGAQHFENIPMFETEPADCATEPNGSLAQPEESTALHQMSPEQAQAITENIRKSLSVAHDLLILAWQQRAWAALGYTSWDAYIESEFSSLALRPPRENQPQTVASMRSAGMSMRAISSATDLSFSTVRRRAREAEESGLKVLSREVLGHNGHLYTESGSAPDGQQESRIRELKDSGASIRGIASEVGVGTGTVRGVLARSAQPSTHADDLGLGQLHVHDRQAPNLAAMFHDDAAEGPQVDVALLSALARAGELLRDHFHPSPEAVGDEVVRAVSTMTAACGLAVCEISSLNPGALSPETLDSSVRLLEQARARALEGGKP